MISRVVWKRTCHVVLLVLWLPMLVACTSPDELRRPCCYEGDLTLAHLEQVRFMLKDGSERPFDQVFKGFEPQHQDVPTPFPFQQIGISGLVYNVLSVVFPTYDANKNGILEEPELAVVYLREGALGLGFQVKDLVVEKPVRALQTSSGEVGGLVTYVDANRGKMSTHAQALFHEIDYLAEQIRRRGVGAADQTFLGP
jgi:hypothetical protein